MTADDTGILTSDRTKRKLTKLIDDTDIIWTTIEKQLVMFQGKELTLKISFNYVDDRSSPFRIRNILSLEDDRHIEIDSEYNK